MIVLNETCGIHLTEYNQVDIQRIHTKLDLYKKLTEPKVNEMWKRQWFAVLASGMLEQDAIQGDESICHTCNLG